MGDRPRALPSWCTGELERAAWAIGADVAGAVAAEVDLEARFPLEAVEAMRERGLLSAMVPVELGGGGARLSSVALATRALACHCASSALVFAMHQIEIAYLSAHGHTGALRALLRDVAGEGLLIANANSETGLGGEIGKSICGLERSAGRFRLEKDVLAISYGEYADAVMVTARRDVDSLENDQVIVACAPGTFELKRTTEWDTMGLRGTGSSGFLLVAEGDEDMILPEAWSTIAARSGIAATMLLLNAVWIGIAEDAARRAHEYVRAQYKKQIGTVPQSAHRLAELSLVLGQLRRVTESTTDLVDELVGTEAMEEPSLLLALRDLKLSSTTMASDVVLKALAICGLSGYRRDSPYSLDRHLRDVLGGAIMANNSRFLAENAFLLLALHQI